MDVGRAALEMKDFCVENAEMTKLTIGDRLTAAALGALFGGMVGFSLAWLFGVYSSTMGPSRMPVDFSHWIAWSAIGFGVVGLLLGPFVGTLIGVVINGIFEFERAEDHTPAWLLVLALLAVVAGVWWSAV